MVEDSSLEIKKGKEIIDEASDKEKWKNCLEFYNIKQFAILAFCLEKEIDPKEFLEYQEMISRQLQSTPKDHPVAQAAIRKMPTKFLLNQFVKYLIQKWQPFQKLKHFTIQVGKNAAIIDLQKCQFRKKLRKYAKKAQIDLSDDVTCFYCEKIFSQGEDFGFVTKIESTKQGCQINIEKK